MRAPYPAAPLWRCLPRRACPPRPLALHHARGWPAPPPPPTFCRHAVSSAAPPSAPPPFREAPFQLRDYQEECIQAVLSHVDEGHWRLGISLATGSGKTVIFTQLISRLTHPVSPTKATQTLILAHRTELVAQAFAHCQRHYPHMSVEVEMGNRHASGVADITVASIASIMSGDRIEKFDRTRFKLILIDECHHAVAPRYLHTLDHFGLLWKSEEGVPANPDGKRDCPILVGVSATMSRFDGLGLGKVLDYIVYHKDYVDMISGKWLCPVTFTTVRSRVDLSKVRQGPMGDFQVGDLSRAVNTKEANSIIVRSWLEKAGQRKSTLVFCVDIDHVTELTEVFRSYGIDARPITSITSSQLRKERLDAFKRREFEVLVNCGVFTEGTDIPNIDCVLLARPTRSKNLLVQMIGRGMRLYAEKQDCHIIDMVGSIERGIVTVPTLLGLDPDELLEGASVEDMQKMKQAKDAREAAALQQTNTAVVSPDDSGSVLGARKGSAPVAEVTFTDYDTVFDLIANTDEDRHIRAISGLAWVKVDTGKYVLSCASKSSIKIEQEEDGTFTVSELRKFPREFTLFQANPHMRQTRILIRHCPSLETAVSGADTYALSQMPRSLLRVNAPWRMADASPQQLSFLEKVRGGQLKESLLHGRVLTKGEANDMITKVKHGAVGRWDRIERKKRAAEKEKKKFEEMKKREQVVVGQLT